jgi:hypothetical protein
MGPRGGPNNVDSYLLSASAATTTKSHDDDCIVVINIYNERKNTKSATDFN